MQKTKPETEAVENSEEITPKGKQKTVNKVGNLLKKMRLQKGLRVSDVSKKLCIRKIYLEAIEESNYEEIPAFPYGVGFIRSYAEFLGLNSSNIVELYKEETNSNSNKNIYVLEPQSEANVPSRKYLVISLVGILLVCVLWQIYNNSTEENYVEDETAIEEATEQQPIVVEEYAVVEDTTTPLLNMEKTTSEVSPETQITITNEAFVEQLKTTENAVEEAVDSPRVVIKIKEETWIEVKDQNKLYISKVLQPGVEYVVPEDGKGMILSIGKVDGAEVYIDGKLTKVARTNKKTNIHLDPFLATNH